MAVLGLLLSGYVYWDQRTGNLADFRDRVHSEVADKPTEGKVRELEARLPREKIPDRQGILASIKAEYEDLLRKETDERDAKLALEAAEKAAAHKDELERRRRDQAAAQQALKAAEARLAQRAMDRAPK